MQQKSLITIFALMLSATSMNAAQQPCNQVLCASAIKAQKICVDEIVVKSGCGQCHKISAKDFMDAQGNLSQTVVIDEPGTWCLCEDVTFNPVDPGTAAIQILSNDVLLDLKENTLRQANKDVSDTYGIQIGQGYNYTDPNAVLQNITITNGSILDFSAVGVFCYNGSYDDPSFDVSTFKSLSLIDLNILNCGSNPNFNYASGINFDSAADVLSIDDPNYPAAYSNVSVLNCKVNHCVGSSAINIFIFDGLVIERTQANNAVILESIVGATFGLGVSGRNAQIMNCQANGMQDLDQADTSGQCGGANLSGSVNMYVKDCQFNDGFGEAVNIVNSNLSNVRNSIFENCQFNNNRGGDTAIEVYGVHISDAPAQTTSTNGLKFINCQFNGVSVSANNPGGTLNSGIAGFITKTTQNITFENCQACNIQTDSPGYSAFGISIFAGSNATYPFGNVQNVTLSNCVISDVSSNQDTAGISTFTYNQNSSGIQGEFTNIVIDNCVVERIHGDSSTQRVAGIELSWEMIPALTPLPKASNLFVRNCRVSDVKAGAQNPYSAGILALSVDRPSLKNNSVSDCDRGVLFSGSELIFPDTYFQLSETFTGATAFPPVAVDLSSRPASLPLQSFDNLFEGNGIAISPSTASINLTRNSIISPVDLNTLGWQSGSQILYDANGGQEIGGLVDGQTYYLIVYVPGYSRNGVVMNNTVDNCEVSGYQDDAPTTSSAWVNNFAFNNGTPASESANYEIVWSGTAPVYAGDLANYPTGSAKAFNISLIP